MTTWYDIKSNKQSQHTYTLYRVHFIQYTGLFEYIRFATLVQNSTRAKTSTSAPTSEILTPRTANAGIWLHL